MNSKACTDIIKKYHMDKNEELYQHTLRNYSITVDSLGGKMDFDRKYNLQNKVKHEEIRLICTKLKLS
jgi:hypothetical protein